MLKRLCRERALHLMLLPSIVLLFLFHYIPLGGIVIDPARCPLAAGEFSRYEYDRDRSGRVLPRYPDHDNHTIDAVRYAMESVSGMKRAVVPR